MKIGDLIIAVIEGRLIVHEMRLSDDLLILAGQIGIIIDHKGWDGYFPVNHTGWIPVLMEGHVGIIKMSCLSTLV